MSCWHNWDVKKTAQRITFSRLRELGGGICIFFPSVVLSGITMILLFVNFPPSKSVSFFDVACLWTLFTTFGTIPWLVLVFIAALILETVSERKDKICIKCHLTILDASRYERDVLVPYQKQKEAKAALKKKTEQETKAAATAAFANRKEMWKKARN